MIFCATDRTVIRFGVHVETMRKNTDTDNKDSPLISASRSLETL
jgi:hypothetical protein